MKSRVSLIYTAASVSVLILAVLVLGACATPPSRATPTIKPGRAYSEGQEILFIHTEASDAGVADKLTKMMNSPVLLVPSLAQAPAEMLANVYVFSNGLQGKGPLGFQPDVFDNPPGTDGYRPLRDLRIVTWKDAATARELKAAADVLAAEQKGEVTLDHPGIVINMPFISWPGGQR
jgi:hypothetical protein